MLSSHINVVEDMDSSKQDINLESDSNSISSTTSVVSIVSGESSTDLTCPIPTLEDIV